MAESKYVLAMYDVRGKQEFIFRTNKLQEIVGGSWIIRDIYEDYLFEAAKVIGGNEKGIYGLTDREHKNDSGLTISEFTEGGFKQHLQEGYIGEVVYNGGGNFLVLFENRDTFNNVTYEFTKTVMERIGTLQILGTCVEINDFSDYKGDNKRLYEEHRKNEAAVSAIAPWSCLPIVQVDRKTTRPLIDYEKAFPKGLSDSVKNTIRSKGVRGKLSKESFAKLLKFHTEKEFISVHDKELTQIERDVYKKNPHFLDDLVLEKGVDSQLAVVYIDGNNMGAKVKTVTEGLRSYEDCVRKLREFSKEIDDVYVKKGTEAAFAGDESLSEKEKKNLVRLVVSAGDEINFIVNAHDAFKCAEKYLNYQKSRENDSSCAGIAVFHSHSPYADAYRIAEEACESGKQKMKEVELKNAAFIDFHICQGAIGTSLEDIRAHENGKIISRPWMMWCKDDREKADNDSITDYKNYVSRVLGYLAAFSRTNIKGMAAASKEGVHSLEMEIKRSYSHSNEEQKAKFKEDKEWILNELETNPDKIRGTVFDLSISYDYWFKGISEKGKEDGKNN